MHKINLNKRPIRNKEWFYGFLRNDLKAIQCHIMPTPDGRKDWRAGEPARHMYVFFPEPSRSYKIQ